METQIRVLISTPNILPFVILSIVLNENISFLHYTKYQTFLSDTLEIMDNKGQKVGFQIVNFFPFSQNWQNPMW